MRYTGISYNKLDCFNLVNHYFKHELKKEIDIKKDNFKEVKNIKKNDILLFKDKDNFHCAVMIDDEHMLSTDREIGNSYIVKLKDYMFKDFIDKVYRYESNL